MSFLSPAMMRFPAIWDLWNGFNRDRPVAEIYSRVSAVDVVSPLVLALWCCLDMFCGVLPEVRLQVYGVSRILRNHLDSVDGQVGLQ